MASIPLKKDWLAHIECLSMDLWGTLIRASYDLPKQMVDYASAETCLKRADIEFNLWSVQREFDHKAISSGKEVPSFMKVNTFLQRCGIRPHSEEEIHALLAEHLRCAPILLYEPQVPDLLMKIEELGVQVTFASNSGYIDGQLMRSVLIEKGLIRSLESSTVAAFSDYIGYAKPDSRFFESAWRGFEPGNVLHIGDNFEADVRGARRFGAHGMQVEMGSNQEHNGKTSTDAVTVSRVVLQLIQAREALLDN